MTEHDEHVRAVLPEWRRPLDTNARRMAEAIGWKIHDDDHPIVAETPAGWLIVAKAPDGSDHAVVRESYEEAAAFLASLYVAKEPPHAETDQHEQAGAGDVRDPGGADVAAAETGVRAADGGGADSGGVDGAAQLEDAVSAQAAEYVAAEVEPKPPADPALDAEVTEAPGATYGGTMVERDDAARLVRQLTIDITYSRIDRVENLKIRRGLLAGQHQRLWALGDLTKDMDIATVNTLDKQIRATDDLIAEIERFGKSMVDSLAGKTLDELKAIDVAAAPWPT